MSFRIKKNPWVLFSPFLLLMVLLVTIKPTHGLYGDEIQYLGYATNLIHGYYSPINTYTDLLLTVGPGYPILLIPFVALNLPVISITYIHAVLFYLSIVLLFKVLQEIVPFNWTIIFCVFWASYYNLYEYILIIYSETFAAFLISLLLFCLLKAFKPSRDLLTNKFVWLAGITFGLLVLTKIIFGYVLLLMFLGTFTLLIRNWENTYYRKGVIIMLFALLTTLPYLVYTFQLTGKFYYWGTTAGNNLYWMSTPYKAEFGDFFFLENPQLTLPSEIMSSGAIDSLRLHHQEDFDEIKHLNGVEADSAFKRKAIINIKSNPSKYLLNIFSNIGRMIYDSPFSYKLQNPRNILRLPHNGILLVLLFFCLIPTFINWKRILFQIKFILFLIFIYLGLSILGSADSRMVTVIVPAILIWIAFILEKSIKVNFKFENIDKN
jgi:4-amino-4-deoxy-L-arabinose transferase-like glycosyltransferase